MRQIIYAIIILYSILIISGCNGNKTTNKLMPELEQAEKVMFDHPDSALHLLESMEIPSSQTDKENHALWCLLTSQAKVKQLMKISSDFKAVEDARGHLQSQPAANVNRN